MESLKTKSLDHNWINKKINTLLEKYKLKQFTYCCLKRYQNDNEEYAALKRVYNEKVILLEFSILDWIYSVWWKEIIISIMCINLYNIMVITLI